MEQKEVLVIRTNLFLTPSKMEEIRQDILKQMSEGIVMIPPCCDAVVVPDGLDVHIECKKEK